MNEIVQACILAEPTWACMSGYWHWLFWVGFFVGLGGAVVQFFMKRTDAP